MGFDFIKACILRKIAGDMIVSAESVKIGEYCIAFEMTGVSNFQVKGIGVH